ncbi:MAG: diguanylate cyclase [Acidobacteriota bacterium]|nr:diguanylate cyclase [Acidobacteriota bacterium]
MRWSRMHTIITPLVVAYAVAVLLVPLEMIQVLAVPVVVAGAYVAGMRGGVTAGLWAVIVSGAAFLLSGAGHVGSYVATAVGYIVIGLLVGLAVDDFTGQRKRLQEAVEAARLANRQLEMSQRRYRLLFEQGADPVYLHGLDHDAEPTSFIAVNDATCGLLGYTREELLGLTPRAIDAAPQPGQLRRMMRVLLREGTVRYESVRRARDGELVPVEIASSLTEVEGEPVVLSISRDIRERQREVRRLEELTLHDELTGLFNRRGLDVMLPQQAKRAKRSGRPVVVMYGDIDEFKRLNDTYGHERGDAVLVAVARALRAAFRETDLVARLGGDEFCVVAEDISAAHLAQRVDDAMEAAGREVGIAVRMSHGEVVSGWPGLEEPAELLGRADARMYQAKQARRRS